MSSALEDTVVDFDLNFLHPSNVVNDCRIDKQRKAILIVKKKTIATDSLIRKFNLNKEKWEQSEVDLLTAKEECKQVCIEYKEALDKCARLEKEVVTLNNKNAELVEKGMLSQNLYEGMRSHAHQLELLVKDHESVIEALKIEKSLEKNNSDDNEKNLSSIQKENEILLKHLNIFKDIALGKKKLRKHHKVLLKKYDKLGNASSDDTSPESGCDEPDFFEDPPPTPLFSAPEESTQNKTEQNVFKPNKVEIFVKKDSRRNNEDNDSDFSNEVVSEDTGRGSSLAFSDGEKCFNSPDYYNTGSPNRIENGIINNKAILLSAVTSPSRTRDVVHKATSPLIFDDEALLTDNNTLFSNETNPTSLEYFITDIPLSDEIVTIKEKRKLIDIGTSPIKEIEKVNIATSPLLFEDTTQSENNTIHFISTAASIETNDVNDNSCLCHINNRIPPEKAPSILIEDTKTSLSGKHTKVTNLSSHCELEISGKTIKERKCLEQNNSKNLGNENSNDGEIEMILNEMRLTERLITPIPRTPIKIHGIESRKAQVSVQRKSEDIAHIALRESRLSRQESKTALSGVDSLRKDLMEFKKLVKDHLKINEPIPEVIEDSTNPEIFDDSSQETIYIYANDEDSCIQEEESVITDFEFSNTLTSERLSPAKRSDENEFSNEIHNDSCTTSDQTNLSSATEVTKTIQIHDLSNMKETTVKELSTISVNNSVNTPINDYHEVITFEEDLRSEDENDIITNIDPSHNDSSIECNNKSKPKHKKMSKLDRFKKKLLPKSKITITSPSRKLKAKLLPVTKKRTLIDPTEILKNKSAYEKAALVMAEIKSKELNSKNINFVSKTSKKKTEDLRKVDDTKDNNMCLEQKKELLDKLNTPVVCLSQLKLDSLPHNIHLVNTNDQDKLNDNDDSTAAVHNITTRSRSRKLSQNQCTSPIITDKTEKEATVVDQKRKTLKRMATDSPNVACKRVLRSSSNRNSYIDLDKTNESAPNDKRSFSDTYCDTRNRKVSNVENAEQSGFDTDDDFLISYVKNKKVDIKSSKNNIKKQKASKIRSHKDPDEDTRNTSAIKHPKQSILCKMIEKYGRTSNYTPKIIPDDITDSIYEMLEESISKINALPLTCEVNSHMDKLADEIQNWEMHYFMSGFMKYLTMDKRGKETQSREESSLAPPMTKSEQVLLYVVRKMEAQTPNTVKTILTHIEFLLFHLNRRPEFSVITFCSHFYALLCRCFGLKTRLRLFLLDGMYCLQFKVIPLINQCLNVWSHILPLAHMGIAKSPLVTCLVYLLHFYKCEDKQVQMIRTTLSKKYFYKITDWNETKILEMFKTAIREVREVPIEKKLLRMALIILGKRMGAKWCQKKIIKGMLMPVIDSENASLAVKQFSVQMLGALIKPFPADMKVHYEIAVNYLHQMLDENPPDSMKEAIFTSLIYLNNHSPTRVIQSLLTWMPRHVSPDFEQLLADYVRGKPVGLWKSMLSRIEL